MKKIFTNKEIWEDAQILSNIITSELPKVLPIRISFVIQSNLKKLTDLYEVINNSRLDIGKKYGKISEDGTSYQVPPEKMELAQIELDQLMEIQQPVEIMMVNLSDLEGCDLTLEQVGAILFMIYDDTEKGGLPAPSQE